VFLLSVNIAFNIFTAFLIEIFVSLQESESEADEPSQQEKNLAVMKDAIKESGQVLHFVEPTEVLRLRTLTGIIEGLDDIIKENNEEAVRAIEGTPPKRPAKQILYEPSTVIMTSLSDMCQAVRG